MISLGLPRSLPFFGTFKMLHTVTGRLFTVRDRPSPLLAVSSSPDRPYPLSTFHDHYNYQEILTAHDPNSVNHLSLSYTQFQLDFLKTYLDVLFHGMKFCCSSVLE